MIIGLTYDIKDDWLPQEDDPTDINAEFDKPKTIQSVIAAIESGGYTVKIIGNFESLIKSIDALGVDIVFNICEGRTGRNRESQVPVLLEAKKIPYVGSDGLTLGITLDKVIAKKLFQNEGIRTPRFFEARKGDDLESLNEIGFPLIVKTRYEGSSKGITSSSRVVDLAGLKTQVAIINDRYGQPALVEEFIAGTEFTVAVIGDEEPDAMEPVQVSIDGKVELGEDFYTFDRIASDCLKYVCPADITDVLKEKLKEMAVEVYKCVDCKDFGRIDFRVDETERPYVLEINPLPSLDVEDVFNIFPKMYDSNYNEVINDVIGFALKRYGLA